MGVVVRGGWAYLPRVRFLLLMLSAALVACGSTGPTCNPATCGGCCTSDDQCVDGTLPSACGSVGLVCNTCSGGQVCTARRCEFPAVVDAGTSVPPDAGMPILSPAEVWQWADFPDSACGNGAPTGLGVNWTNRSKDVFLYLQGGGACWSGFTCALGAAANIGTGYGGASFANEATLRAPPFSRTTASNPFKDMSYVFVPYCTGDVHAGDAVTRYPATAQSTARTVFHKGAKNMEAFLVRLKDTFPDAERIFVSGSSAGAYGAQLNYERVRATWPGAEVHLLADCGQMVTPAGTLFQDWLTAWNVAIPTDCVGCSTDFSQYPKYLHAKYSAARFGLLAFTQDSTLRQFAAMDATTFEQATLALTSSAYDPTPNGKYFVVAASTHVMLGNLLTQVGPGGVTLLDWTTRLVNGDSTWQSVKP